MQPKHYTTRIFIGLFIITMLLTYLALALTTRYNQDVLDNALSDIITTPKQKVIAEPAPVLLSTADWSVYSDKTYPIAFSYPKGWQITSNPPAMEDFYDITIKPSDKTANFHITISKVSFYGFEGLKLKPYSVGNLKGQKAYETLVGIKEGEYYYTFDASSNPKKIDEFNTLMSTVEFLPVASE